MNIEEFPHPEEDRKKEEKTAEGLAKYVNATGEGFLQAFQHGSIEQAIDNARTRITPKEVQEADAYMMDKMYESKDLSSPESDELKLRESGNFFLSKDFVKDTQADFGRYLESDASKAMFKEAFYERDLVQGYYNGEKIVIERIAYPVMSEKELRNESQKDLPFYGDQWKGPITYVYHASVGDKGVSQGKAHELWSRYAPLAEKRTNEVSKIKHDREKEKLGDTIDLGFIPDRRGF